MRLVYQKNETSQLRVLTLEMIKNLINIYKPEPQEFTKILDDFIFKVL